MFKNINLSFLSVYKNPIAQTSILIFVKIEKKNPALLECAISVQFSGLVFPPPLHAESFCIQAAECFSLADVQSSNAALLSVILPETEQIFNLLLLNKY